MEGRHREAGEPRRSGGRCLEETICDPRVNGQFGDGTGVKLGNVKI